MSIKKKAESRTSEYEEGPDGYLGELEEFVNMKNGEVKKMRPVYKGASLRYKGGFALVFNTGFCEICNYVSPGGVLSFLIMKMNNKNICKVEPEKIAEAFGCTDRSIRNHLNKLVKSGAIVKCKKGIMVNPLYAVKCKAEDYKDIAEEYDEFKDEMIKKLKNKKQEDK